MAWFLRPFAAALVCAASLVAPAAAQSSRITALPATDVFSVRALDDTIVAGMDTVVFVSTDGGATWHGSSRPAPTAKIIDAVWIRNRRVYAGTFGLGVFVSDDLGATWQPFNQGLVGGFLDSQLDIADLEVRDDDLFAATFGAGVYARNLAVADTWHPFGNEFEPNQASNVNDLALGGSRLLACAGANGTTFHRDPGDADWTISFFKNNGLDPGLSAQTALWTGTRWVVGTNAGVFFSANGEDPWTPSSTRLAGLAWTTLAQIGGTLFAAFDSANVVLLDQSTNGGADWTRLETVNGRFAYQLAVHGDDLYAARSDGLWVRRGVTASVEAAGGSRLLRFTLAGPQPVRDVARFRFVLPEAASTAFELFDVAGRRASDRIESHRSAGPQEMTVSVRPLSPGVYLARLTAGSRRESLPFVRVP